MDTGFLDTLFTFVLKWVGMMPQNGWAIVLSVIIASIGTQWLKMTFSYTLVHEWGVNSELTYKTIVRVVSLLLGFAVCYNLWPVDIYRFWTSVATALIAPILYKFTMYFVYKKWPDLEAKLSGLPE